MKRLKSIVVFSLLSIIEFQLAAQDINKLGTPYEKARAALADSAVAAIMKNDLQLTLQIGLAMSNMKDNNWSEWKQLEFMEQVIATAWGAYQWGEPQTYNDFRAFERIGPACEEYARKRDALEKTKTPLDIQREERRYYVPPAGALSTVLMKTRDDFAELMRKGEFEKKVQFRQRIAETGLEIFDSIAYSYCWQYAIVSARNAQMKYDVESELDSLYLWHQENNKMLAICHMSPEMAQRVSKKKKNFLVETLKVCVVNGDVLPYKIAMATDEEQWMYVFHPLSPNAVMDTNIAFSVAKTGITDTNILQVMGTHVFDYNNYMAQLAIKEQERVAKEQERKAREEYERNLANRLSKLAEKMMYDIIIRSFIDAEHKCRDLNNIPNSIFESAHLSVLKDFEKDFGMELDECRYMLRPIEDLRHSNKSKALEYIRMNNTTERDIERLEVLYSERYKKVQYDEALTQLDATLDLLNRLMYTNNNADSRLSLLMLKQGRERYYASPSPRELIEKMDDLKIVKYTTLAYAMLAEFIVNENKEASKEWEKYKDKYKDIVEFYEHYISVDYKTRE